MILVKVNLRHSMIFTSFHKLITITLLLCFQLKMQFLSVVCLFVICVPSFLIFKKERKVVLLKGRLAEALKEGDTLSQERDSLI